MQHVTAQTAPGRVRGLFPILFHLMFLISPSGHPVAPNAAARGVHPTQWVRPGHPPRQPKGVGTILRVNGQPEKRRVESPAPRHGS